MGVSQQMKKKKIRTTTLSKEDRLSVQTKDNLLKDYLKSHKELITVDNMIMNTKRTDTTKNLLESYNGLDLWVICKIDDSVYPKILFVK